MIMDFKIGDTVIHGTYGLGRIVRLEEQSFSGKKTLYYVVQVRDMTIWIPADGRVLGRLRSPIPPGDLPRLISILKKPGRTLPDDRLERKEYLLQELKDGKAESCCRVVRDLTFLQFRRPLNDHDRLVLKRTSDLLLGEWEFSLSIPLARAQDILHGLLIKPSQPLANS
jgi:RNA polymerase-interacting CarD/CdnL/TRCF family regulator